MPRDDLSIDFVRKMPVETLDPGLVLDDWINRAQNLPEEIKFIQEEILEKDRRVNECVRGMEERDGKIQKWIRTHGSAEPNPKEKALRDQIRERYATADRLAGEKIALCGRLRAIMDKHVRSLDQQIKTLYDRAELGFTDPDELPSLLRASAANTGHHSAPLSERRQSLANPAAHPAVAAAPLTLNPTSAISSSGNAPARATAVMAAAAVAAATAAAAAPPPQAARVSAAQSQPTHATSAPTTPAASALLHGSRGPREGSAGPAPKRGPRTGAGLANVPITSSGLARHSSLGPGTPKAGAAGAGSLAGAVAVAAGHARAGSAGPRAGSIKGAAAAGSGAGRKGTPAAAALKRLSVAKSTLSRVKKSHKNSPVSAAESELSDMDSGAAEGNDETGKDERAAGSEGRRRPRVPDAKDRKDRRDADHRVRKDRHHKAGADGGEGGADGDADEDDEASDNRKYCTCQNVSYGDMVACDNADCPYEWFHWSCVGLRSEPNGAWYCPVCIQSTQKSK